MRLFLLLLALAATGCLHTPTAQFEVHTIDALTSTPLGGVTLTSGVLSAATDPTGMVLLSVPEFATFTLTFTAPGYQLRQEPYRLNEPSASTTVALTPIS